MVKFVLPDVNQMKSKLDDIANDFGLECISAVASLSDGEDYLTTVIFGGDVMSAKLSTSEGERSEGEEPTDSRASRGVKPLWSTATQGAPGQFNSMSTGVFAWD